MLFLHCFLDVLEDATDELISFGLRLFYAVFEAFDFVEMPDVDILVQEEEFAVLGYDVGQVVLIGLADILEPEQISLVQLKDRSRVPLPDLRGVLQRR